MISWTHYCIRISAQMKNVCLCLFEPPEVEAEPARQPGERPSKRCCFWEYRRARESSAKKKLGGDVHWSLSWSSSTLPSTLYRREGENINFNADVWKETTTLKHVLNY